MKHSYREASKETTSLFLVPIFSLCELTSKEEKISINSKRKILLSGGFLLVSFSFFLAQAQAQVVPDATLPVNSIVTPSGNTNIIEGGTRAGGNLFHSFQEFSVPTRGEAFFNNALDIQNIFSRVTGRSISRIDGLIRANGTANLFFLNPNGIIFGPNAQLNIGGSFLASTANSIKFGDGTEFSTINPQTTPLLTIGVPVGLQMGSNPGNIVVQGSGNNLTSVPDIGTIIRDDRPVGLQVAPGQTLALLGGNLALEGGNLTADSGRIELGSVGGETLVTLTLMNPGIALSYPDTQNFQDISLSQAASVDVSGAGGGSVFVVGRRVTMTDGSGILSLTEGDKAGGTLSIRASEVVEAIGTTPDGFFNSGLFTEVQPEATGDGGDVTIETRSLTLREGAQISTTTFGEGKAGKLTIKATDTVELISSVLSTSAGEKLTGDGGNVTIETRKLTLEGGAFVSTDTFGQGKAGNLTVKATDIVELIGTSADGQFGSGLSAQVNPEATGDGGNLTINTARLRVVDGAQISTATFSSGKAGNLNIKATDTVELIGGSANGNFPSALGASVESEAIGDGGNLTIDTDRLRVVNGAQVSTGTFGSGKAGNLSVKATDTVELIGTSANGRFGSSLSAQVNPEATGDGGILTIDTANLRVINGSRISANTFGSGKAGNLSVKATDTVELIGTSANGQFGSSLSAQVQPGATGNGGNLTINTARLRVANGAQVSVATFGSGKAGNLSVKATDMVELIDRSADSKFPSGLSAQVQPGAIGNGGNLTIKTARLRVANGAQVSVATFGSGKAGNLSVKATDIVELIGRSADGKFGSALGASVESEATGDGGSLMIDTDRLLINDGAQVSVRSSGEGKAGNLTVNADSIRLDNLSSLTADTKAGDGSIELRSPTITLRGSSSITTNASGGESGGDIKMRTGFLQLRNSSRITTNAQGENVIGGNITLNADVIVGLENSDITANSINSQGGNITINTQGIFGLQTRTREELQSLLNTDDPTLLDPRNLPTSDITATGANSSLSGTLTINIPEVNPTSGLVDLPANPVDATALVASTCRPRGREQGEFIFTGRGGLPPSPNELIRNEATWMDLREIILSEGDRTTEQRSREAGENGELASIVEAQGWVKNSQGQVVLVAQTATATSQKSTFIPEYCHE